MTTRIHALTKPALAAALAVLALAGCNRADERAQTNDPTVGQQVDRAIASAENAGDKAKQATTEAARDVQAGAKDATITTKVNAALAADDKLSAIRIDVDTSNGKVTLSGTAPDAASRDRATTLVSAVDGVVSVENRLTVN